MIENILIALGPASIIGMFAGAILAHGLFGEPHRSSATGQFKTHRSSAKTWVIKTIVGGALGAISGPIILGLILSAPRSAIPIAGIVGLIVLYIFYKNAIDPR